MRVLPGEMVVTFHFGNLYLLSISDYLGADGDSEISYTLENLSYRPLPVYTDEYEEDLEYYSYEIIEQVPGDFSEAAYSQCMSLPQYLEVCAENYQKEWGGEVTLVDEDIFCLRRPNG